MAGAKESVIELVQPSGFNSIPWHGVEAEIDGQRVLFSNRRLMAREDVADTQQLTDGELFYIISNGAPFTGMPAFGGEDSPESI